MNELKVVEFNSDELKAIKTKSGKIYVGVSYVCNGIGFDKNGKDAQVKKIQADYILSRGCEKFDAGIFDKDNETLGIELDYLPIWLAKISITPTMIETNPQLAEKLFEYQMKAKDVLAEAFLDNKPKIPQTYAEALLEAGRLALENERLLSEVKQKDEVILEQKPKVDFAERLLKSKDNLLVREYSKVIYDDGIQMGEKKLYAWLRTNGYLMKNNEPYQNYMKYFFIKETSKDTPFGIKIFTTTMINPTGQIYFYNKLKG